MGKADCTHRGAMGLARCLLLVLGGCGGGGDGGGISPVAYTGSTSQAVVSATNAAVLTADVVVVGEAADLIAGASVGDGSAAQPAGRIGLPRRLARDLRSAVLATQALTPPASGVLVPVDQTLACSGGGTVHTTGSLDDVTGTGNLNLTFSECTVNGDVLNGQVTVRVDLVDPGLLIPLDSTYTTSRMTLRGPGLSIDVGGTFRVQLSPFANQETDTESLVQVDNITGRTTKSENLVFNYTYNNFFAPSFFDVSVMGRVFDAEHGYVDITPPVPLHFATLTQLFPDSGVLQLTGAGSGVLVTASSSTLAKLEVDTDGIPGTFEHTATLKWSELTGPIGADLADSDGDQMHNSWETAYGLDPMVMDATPDDLDGDGADNLTEYLAGTAPNDVTSHP